MGDLNAKVAVTEGSCNQTASRNGTLQTEFTKQTETTVINTMEKHQGTWTRQNRKNRNKKSIIDYIIEINHLAAKVLESTTEDGTTYLIRGNNPTDHNIRHNHKKRTQNHQAVEERPIKDWENFNQTLATDWIKPKRKETKLPKPPENNNKKPREQDRVKDNNTKQEKQNIQCRNQVSKSNQERTQKPCSIQHANTTTQINSYTWRNT